MYNELSERKKDILKAVVEMYIESGGAVGSKMILEHEQMNVSSATIRNELAELTDLGYLIQPHTSSGRTPSEKAYRFYVDYLKSSYSETSQEIEDLNLLLKEKSAHLDKIIDDAGKLAGALTNLPAIAIVSGKMKLTVKRFSLMQNDEFSFIILMLIGKNNVRTRTVTTAFPIDEKTIMQIQEILNDKLANIDPSEITFSKLMEIEKSFGEYSMLASPIIKCVCEALSESPGSIVNIDGVDRLLEYPEFSDTENLKSFLGLLSRKDDLVKALEKSDDSGVNVYIGSENVVENMSSSSLVFKTIRVDGVAVGAIGIIGPCRMDYQKVMSTIGTVSDTIAKMLADPPALTDGNDSNGGKND